MAHIVSTTKYLPLVITAERILKTPQQATELYIRMHVLRHMSQAAVLSRLVIFHVGVIHYCEKVVKGRSECCWGYHCSWSDNVIAAQVECEIR